MTKTKKVVATILALLMIFSSFSVLGSAADPDDTPSGTLTATIKLFKEVDGVWTEISGDVSNKVTPGDTVKARVYMTTDFYTFGGRLLINYDNGFLSCAQTGSLAKLNEGSSDYFTGKKLNSSFPAAGKILVVFLGTPDPAVVYRYTSTDWLFEIPFTVASTYEEGDDTEGYVWLDANDVSDANSASYVPNSTTFPMGEEGDGVRDTIAGRNCNLTVSYEDSGKSDFTSVTVENSVEFDAGDLTLSGTSPVTGIIGENYTPCSASATGYTFLGWYVDGDADETVVIAPDATTFTMPVEETTYNAKYQKNITIKFDTDGGTAIADITQQDSAPIYGGLEWKAANKPAAPTKTGYIFNGWEGTGAVNGNLPATFPEASGETTEFTYTAKWIPLTVKVIYKVIDEDNNEKNVITARVPFDRAYTVASYEDEEIAEITSWSYSDGVNSPVTLTAGTEYEFNGDGSNAINVEYRNDNTYVLYFTASITSEDLQQYTATFVGNGGYFDNDTTKTSDVQNYAVGEAITAPTPVYPGYEFICWDAEPDTMGTEDLVFTAIWGESDYDVTFDFDPVEDTEELTLSIGEIEECEAPSADGHERAGYTLTGWEVDIGTGRVDYTAANADVIAAYADANGKEFTAYAQWEANEYIISYYKLASDTTAVDTRDFETDETVSDSDVTTTRTGYQFRGWTYTPALIGGTKMPAGDVKAVAKWESLSIKVIYKVTDADDNEKTVITARVPFGEEYTIASFEDEETEAVTAWTKGSTDYAPGSKYTFTEADFNNQPVVFEADVNAKTYTATFVAAGGYFDNDETKTADKEAEYVPGQPIVAPTVAKTGYNFICWDVEPDTMGDEDITFTAIWAIKADYTITFLNGYDDGVIEEMDNQVYDTGVEIPADPERTGYVFEGWSNEEEGTVLNMSLQKVRDESSQTYYAIWSNDSYTITYTLDGAAYPATGENVDTYAYGADVTLRQKAAKTGYTVSDWTYYKAGTETTVAAADLATMPAYDVEAKATSTVNQYTITYTLDDAAYPDEAGKTDTYNYGASVTLRNKAVKTGHTTTAWKYYKAGTTAEVAVTDLANMPDYNVVAKATSTVNQYTISFDSDGGSEVEPIPYDYGAEVTEPTAPTKNGYNFSKWVYKSGEHEGEDFIWTGAKMPAEDIELKAEWTPHTYTVRYNWNGATKLGGQADTATVTVEGTALALPVVDTNFSKEGNIFQGWFRDEDLTDGPLFSTLSAPKLASDETEINLYAKWSVNNYTITYTLDGAAYPAAGENVDTYAYGADVTLRQKAAKTGYNVTDWKYYEAGTENEIQISGLATMPAKNVEAKATSTIKLVTISFDSDGGDAVTEITQNYDTDVTKPADPTKTGYTFSKWVYKTGANEGSEFNWTGAKMPADDIELKAEWTKNEYHITYKAAGGNWSGSTSDKMSDVMHYQDTVSDYTHPTRTGYEFLTWSYDPVLGEGNTMPAADVEATATWSAKTYTVKFFNGYEEGVLVEEEPDQVFDTFTDVPADPDREGYTFAGWSLTAEGEKIDNINAEIVGDYDNDNGVYQSYYALWTKNSYTITYTLDGSAYPAAGENVDTYAFEAAVTLRQKATKTGYTTTDWTYYEAGTETVIAAANLAAMPAKNVDAKATSTPITYTVTFDYGEDRDSQDLGGTTKVLAYDHLNETPNKDYANDTAFADAVYPGARFLSWQIDNGAGGTVAYSPANIAQYADSENKITVTAEWRFTAYGTYFDVVFLASEDMENREVAEYENGDEAAFNVEEGHGTLSTYGATLPPVSRDGYTVTWQAENGDTVDDTYLTTHVFDLSQDDIDSDGKVFIIPVFTGKPAAVSYVVNGAEVATDTATYGTAYSVKGYSADETHSVAGWTISGTTTPVYAENDEYTVTLDNITNGITFTADLKYTVTFDANDGTFTVPADATKTYVPGATVVAPAVTRDGYSLTTGSEWTYVPALTDGTKMPAADVAATANWTAHTYQVNYHWNSGTKLGSQADTASVTVDGAALTLPVFDTDFERTGYDFDGWFDNVLCSGTAIGATYTAPKFADASTQIDLYAKYTAKEYTITFDSDGGSVVTEITEKYLTAINKPTNPEKAGYTFSKWVYKSGEHEGEDFIWTGATMPLGGAELKAVWTRENDYTITYVLGGGSVATPNPATYNVETETFTLNNPVYAGHTFEGWTGTGLTAATQTVTIAKGSTGNRTYTAVWSETNYGDGTNPDPLDDEDPTNDGDHDPDVNYDKGVFFYANGGAWADDSTQQVIYDQTFGSQVKTPDDAPVYAGHTFGGWATSATGSAADMNSQTVKALENEKQEYYAVWSDTNYGDGTNPDPLDDEDPTNDGDHDPDVNYDKGIKFYFEDGETAPVVIYNQVFGAKVKKPTDPSRTGYTFKGWAAEANGTVLNMVNENVKALENEKQEYYAVWAVNEYGDNYAVRFNGNGGKWGTNTDKDVYGQTFGQKVITPSAEDLATLKNSGHTFDGWLNAADGTEKLDMDLEKVQALDELATEGKKQIYYAKWINTDYGDGTNPDPLDDNDPDNDGDHDPDADYDKGVVFLANTGSWEGGAVKQVIYGQTFGSQVKVPSTNPSKEGYNFKGWASTANGTVLDMDAETVAALEDNTQVYYAVYNGWTYDPGTNPVDPEDKVDEENDIVYETGVTFDFNYEVEPRTVTVEAKFNEVIANAPAVIRTGYIFKGWAKTSDAEEGSMTVTLDKVPTEEDPVIYYAVWEAITGITVTYIDVNPATGAEISPAVDTQQYEMDQDITATTRTPAPKTGYTFKGWSDTKGGAVKDPLGKVTNPDGMTFYAVYELISDYVVTFNANGGEYDDEDNKTVQSQSYAYGDKVEAPATALTKEGYYVAGYSTVQNAEPDDPSVKTDLGYLTEEYYTLSDLPGYFAIWAPYKYSPNEDPAEDEDPTNDDEHDDHTFYNTGVTFYRNYEGATEPYYKAEATYGENISVLNPERIGYQFSGWAKTSDAKTGSATVKLETVPTAENPVNFYATWTVLTVKVQYKVNDSIVGDLTSTVPFDQAYTIASYVDDEIIVNSWTKGGVSYDAGATYNFTETDFENQPVIFTNGEPEAKQNKATFIADGGYFNNDRSLTENQSADIAVGAAIVAPTVAKDGYIFLGWDPEPSTMGTEDLEFTALWSAIEYEVTFDFGEGRGTEVLSHITVNDLAEVPSVNGHEWEGHELTGWQVKNNADEMVTYNAANVAQYADSENKITVYAKWSDGAEYTIYYFADEADATDISNAVNSQDVVCDTVVDSTGYTASKTGFKFKGWTYDPELVDGKMPAQNVNAIAIWESHTIKVKYMVDGKAVISATVPFGQAYTVASYEDEGIVTISEWTKGGDTYAAGATYNFTDTDFENQPVIFSADSTAATYTVTFQGNGGKYDAGTEDEATYKEVSFTYGQQIVAPEGLKYPGYDQDGWQEGDLGTCVGDATYTANWKVKDTYTVKFLDENDVEIESQDNQTFGKEVEAPAGPDKDGYVFRGWAATKNGTVLDMNYETVGEYDNANGVYQTYYAVFEVRTVSVKYVVNGDEVSSATATYDEPFVLAAYYADATHSVTEWTRQGTADKYKVGDPDTGTYTVSVADLDNGIVFEAALKYKATFQAKGGKFAGRTNPTDDVVLEYAPGEQILEEDWPTVERDGYTFDGWDPEPSTMGTEDLEFEAQWKAIYYTATFKYALITGNDVTVTPDAEGDYREIFDDMTYGQTFNDYGSMPPEYDASDLGFDAAYTFKGWYIKDSEGKFTIEVDEDEYQIKEDVEIYAVYTKPEETSGEIKVQFIDTDGETVLAHHDTFATGDKLSAGISTLPTATHITGMSNEGWYDNAGNPVTNPAEYTVDEANAVSGVITISQKVTVIKLIPAEGKGTIIERTDTTVDGNGAAKQWAETNDTTGLTVPRGINREIINTVTDSYNPREGVEYSKDFDNYFIYGLAESMSEDDLRSYITTTGTNSRIDIKLAVRGKAGTGTIVKVIDTYDESVVEQFYVVIFGDVTGDGVISPADTGPVANKINAAGTSWDASKIYYTRAAGLQDGKVAPADLSVITDCMNNSKSINQRTSTIA